MISKKRNLADYRYLFILASSSSIIMLSLNKAFKANAGFYLIGITITLTIITSILAERKFKLIAFYVSTVFIIALGFYLSIDVASIKGFLIKFSDIYPWIDYLSYFRDYDISYINNIYLVALTPVVFLVMYVFLKLLANAFLATGLGFIIVSASMSLFFQREWLFPVIYLATSVLCHSIDRYYSIDRAEGKAGKLVNKNPERWFYNALGIATLSLCIVIFLPKTGEGVVGPIFEMDLASGKTFIADSRFSIYGVGFSERDYILGGPANPTDEIILRVKSPVSTYLRGTIMTDYDGNSWKSNYETTPIRNDGRVGIHYNSQLELGYFHLDIRHEGIITSTIFSPLQPRNISDTARFGKITDDFEIILGADERLVRGFSYGITAVMPRITEEELLSLEINHDQDVNDKYLRLPDDYSQRVLRLAEEIIRDKATDYEKVHAIREYLRSNFAYDLNSDHIEIGQDFVDNFIFEQGKGYCTHFASAMVILSRAAGVPARYVEGFIMPFEAEDNGYYYVRSYHGHAWAEIYLRGYGWFIIEATPAYSTSREMLPPLDRSYREIEDFDAIGRDALESFEDREQLIDEENGSISLHQIEQPSKVNDRNHWIVLGLTIVLLIGVLELYAREKSMSFQGYYVGLIKLLKILGYEEKPGETLMEYCVRIQSQIPINGIDLKQLTNDYYEQVFSRGKHNRFDNHDVKEAYYRVKSLALARHNKYLVAYKLKTKGLKNT